MHKSPRNTLPRGVYFYSNDELPFSLAINSGVYGYKDTSNNFHSFKSQADIDAAISAARVGTATAAQVLTGYTFTNSSSSGLNGSMTNQGTKTYTINPGGSQTIPAGYHSGSGSVTANANQNSGTYTYPANSTGGTYDMGINNTYRYVNATNVYNKGKADGKGTGPYVPRGKYLMGGVTAQGGYGTYATLPALNVDFGFVSYIAYICNPKDFKTIWCRWWSGYGLKTSDKSMVQIFDVGQMYWQTITIPDNTYDVLFLGPYNGYSQQAQFQRQAEY